MSHAAPRFSPPLVILVVLNWVSQHRDGNIDDDDGREVRLGVILPCRHVTDAVLLLLRICLGPNARYMTWPGTWLINALLRLRTGTPRLI
jgi:hypothetical protein